MSPLVLIQETAKNKIELKYTNFFIEKGLKIIIKINKNHAMLLIFLKLHSNQFLESTIKNWDYNLQNLIENNALYGQNLLTAKLTFQQF